LIDSGNNLGHLCCLYGQAECLNCCIQHDIPINKVNNFGENPFELARKVGKALHIEKAGNNVYLKINLKNFKINFCNNNKSNESNKMRKLRKKRIESKMGKRPR